MKQLLIIACTAVTGGCGLLVDGAYLLGDGRYSEQSEDSQATDQALRRIEYDARPTPDGALEIQCFARTRAIERNWTVSKTYRYRGGFPKVAYTTTAVLDGLWVAGIAGAFLAACNKEDADVSCKNVVWATPFAVDLVYSLVRRAWVKSPVLVDKQRSSDQLGYAAEPTDETAVACDAVTGLWLGAADGPSDEDVLRGHSHPDAVRQLAADAIELPLAADGAFQLDAEAAEAWAQRNWLRVWVVDRESIPHPVNIDRCTVLRARITELSSEARTRLDRDCPAPAANGQVPVEPQ